MSLPTNPDAVWAEVERWPFAVLSFVTSGGESRSAGIMYRVRDRKLYVVTGVDTWKVRHIETNPHVSVTVTVQRLPIRVRAVPPAVITFAGIADVRSLDEVPADLLDELTRGVSDDLGQMCVIEIVPEGRFVTYGIGIPAMQMRHPERSLARVPVR